MNSSLETTKDQHTVPASILESGTRKKSNHLEQHQEQVLEKQEGKHTG